MKLFQAHSVNFKLRRIVAHCQCETITLKLKGNFEIYIADRKATTCIWAKLFLLRCVKVKLKS